MLSAEEYDAFINVIAKTTPIMISKTYFANQKKGMKMVMRISKNYVLQKITDEYIVVPVGEAAIHMQGIIRLNATGAFLWDLLCNRSYAVSELIEKLTAEFNVDKDVAQEDICKFIAQLSDLGCLDQQ